MEESKKYKLRFYHKSGAKRGNFEHEEFFRTIEELDARYKEVYTREDAKHLLTPTAWKYRYDEFFKTYDYFRMTEYI